jgi:hypothetical protein
MSQHILWNKSEPGKPYMCERTNWSTCPEHKHLTDKQPKIKNDILLGLKDSTADLLTLDAYKNESQTVNTERRYALDPRSINASLEKAQKIIGKVNKKGLEGGFKVWVDDSKGYSELVVSGEPYKLNGWSFVASIERLPNGEAITKKSAAYMGRDVEQELLDKENVCEHCNTNRRRKMQVIVENGSQRLVVGSGCIKDFLGWDYSPSYIMDLDELEEKLGSGITGAYTVKTDEVLSVALAMKEEYGFVAASNVSEGSRSTKDMVKDYLYALDKKMAFPEIYNKLNTKDYSKKISEIKESVEIETANSVNDYSRNMKAAFTGDLSFESTIGLVVSGISMDERRKAKAATPAKQEFSEAIYAPEGTKVSLNVRLIHQTGFESAYGYGQMYTFANDTHKFRWFSSRDIDLETGSNYSLTGTVKALSVYNGQSSTLLTRCKVK